MIIGIPKEIKNNEFRVAMVPKYVRQLIEDNHQVLVETQAGLGVGYSDQDYLNIGAEIVTSAQAIFAQADMIVKVKEPQAQERLMLRSGQIIFTYLHLAPDLEQTQELMHSQAICIAYETIEDDLGHLPLLAPMSEVAGRMAVQVGAHFLEKPNGGKGILLGGVTGVKPAKVLILGSGTVGKNAAQLALGLEANVTIMTHSENSSQKVKAEFGEKVATCVTTTESLHQQIVNADLIVGAVLVPGASTPKLVTKSQLKQMKPGSVLVDVAIDQGGCFETSRPTTHENPTYIIDNIVHYCVANIPGAVPKTSSVALNNATQEYILKLANQGYKQALLQNDGFLKGLNIYHGHITCENVALSHNLPYSPARTLLENG
ncbi:MAG: alanine dehydrogenase [Pseudomonadota bacterium]|nr:alanine dehydrogenase [Pseudomonadota bacterium]